MAVSTFNNSGL